MKRFGIVNYDVMSDPEISIQAKGLYALLSCYANQSRMCYPSISTLADVSNKSTTQISVYIKELKSKNYIIRINRNFKLL
tara:strand:+ start:984 stop:1223 length:240 start_codon:yes stop_codon:yes gene_type:complete